MENFTPNLDISLDSRGSCSAGLSCSWNWAVRQHDESLGQQPKCQAGTRATRLDTLPHVRNTVVWEIMLVKILIHLDVLLAVLIWWGRGGNSGRTPESELAFLVAISTAITCTANSCLTGFLRTAPDTGQWSNTLLYLYLSEIQDILCLSQGKKGNHLPTLARVIRDSRKISSGKTFEEG